VGWWSSLETVSFLSTMAQWIVAIMGVAVLVFGLRASALQQRADEGERAQTAAAVAEARSRADESLDRQRPRGITPEQRAAFLAAAANQLKGSVTVIPVMGNAEAEQYARQLADLLRAGGYGVEAGGMLPMDNTPVGLGLTVRRDETYPQHADALQTALNQAGIPVGRGFNGLQSPNVLGLVVGTKPAQ